MMLVIGYDCADNKRRRRIFKLLSTIGIRVQYSLFELNISSSQYRKLKSQLFKEIDEQEDSLRIYRISPRGLELSDFFGQESFGSLTNSTKWFIV